MDLGTNILSLLTESFFPSDPGASLAPRQSDVGCLVTRLTDVRRDDGEGAEVGLPHVARQRVGVLLEAAQQCRRAPLRVLDELPVWPCVWSQDGAADPDQILPGGQREDGVRGLAEVGGGRGTEG